jgi:hypothetical protein
VSQLVNSLQVGDVEFLPNGAGHALVRRGKTDAEGQGRVAYLSRETVRSLKIRLERAKSTEGVIFSTRRPSGVLLSKRHLVATLSAGGRR